MRYKGVSYHDFDRIKKMSLNDFRRWTKSVYESGFADGLDDVGRDASVSISDDQLLDIILSVKGIGRRRAEEVVQKILSMEGMDDESNA